MEQIIRLSSTSVLSARTYDGLLLGSRGINKNGAHEQDRLQVRHESTAMKVAKGTMKLLPARTLKKGEVKPSGSFSLLKRPSASASMKHPWASTHMKRLSALASMKHPSVHRRPLPVLKKPAASLKLNGKWLWRGSLPVELKSIRMKNGLKKITHRLLPRASQAVNSKPRGLHETRHTLHRRTHTHTQKKNMYWSLILDGWTATTKGYMHPPSVKNHKCFRDAQTGFHTNDAESENNRLKRWSRQCHGHLRIEEYDMQEYMFYVNIGNSMMLVLEGLAQSDGSGKCKNRIVTL